MPEQSKSTPLDLTRYTEATRRELYDRVVLHIWTPIVPGEYTPSYSAEEAQLVVVYLFGRWIVAWNDLEEESEAPPDQRAVMSRILASPDSRFGVMLSEI